MRWRREYSHPLTIRAEVKSFAEAKDNRKNEMSTGVIEKVPQLIKIDTAPREEPLSGPSTTDREKSRDKTALNDEGFREKIIIEESID